MSSCFPGFSKSLFPGFFVWDPGVAKACACAAQVLDGETPAHHQRRCGVLCLRPKQQPHLKVPAVLSNQVPGKRNTRSSLSSFSSKVRSAGQRLLSVDCLEEVLSQVVGTDGLDVYAMMNGKILDLRSTLRFFVASLMVARSTFTIDSEEEVVRMCLGSGRVHNVSRSVAGQCVKGATGVVRQGRICMSLPKGKGMGKGILQLDHLVENRHRHDSQTESRAASRSS